MVMGGKFVGVGLLECSRSEERKIDLSFFHMCLPSSGRGELVNYFHLSIITHGAVLEEVT